LLNLLLGCEWQKIGGGKEVNGKLEIIEVAPPPVSKELKKRWSYFIRKVYETDPLVCPKMLRRNENFQLHRPGTSLPSSLVFLSPSSRPQILHSLPVHLSDHL